MSGFGRFLEFSARTPNILDSLGYYKMLGFTELEIGDVWPHKYAVVSDGVLCIGLHDRVFDAPAISFVQQDLAIRARSMTDHGFNFSFMRLDEDVFNELGLADRDGHMITMLEARTFSGGDQFDNDSVCGTWFELTLPARDAVRSARFWASVAPNLLRMREEPTAHMRFEAGGVAIGLSESIALDSPSLSFKCHDKEALSALIDKHGLEHQKFPGFEGAFVALKAPEGTMLYAFDEDFLGETIEVEESDDLSEFPQ
ncbi:MAG: hypothetical protein OEU90_00610 [Gammaproteobacteria bacterium]|nr:hypothetical protein [Gammaproteobacteria bacterium]MDH3749893.1 hypothetical protein [Gammaproteobacteria bacterium]MDH3803949.1 hypothetical protein [Gammaproteobacteria bacterium]